MIINHNLSAINAHRHTINNIWSLDQQSEKLSSGLRINRGRDDAAGLAVSEKMRAQVRGLTQASRNIQDGISMIQTAEGWLQETHSILQRMGELAVQAANGTYTDSDRAMIQTEVNQLIDEIDRISKHAEFNTMVLFNGQFAKTGSLDINNPSAAASPTASTPVAATVTSADAQNGIWVHVGANTDQRVLVNIDKINSETLSLGKAQGTTVGGISVSVPDKANQAINTIHEAIQKVSKQRTDLGAMQNRLEHTYQGVSIATENLQAAESRIRDADMAKEMIDYVRSEILTTAATSMLAQANVTPQLVLRILR